MPDPERMIRLAQGATSEPAPAGVDIAVLIVLFAARNVRCRRRGKRKGRMLVHSLRQLSVILVVFDRHVVEHICYVLRLKHNLHIEILPPLRACRHDIGSETKL